MKKIIYKLISAIHEYVIGVKPPQGFVASLGTLIILLFVGTLFYSNVEGWSYVDSFYFSAITLATVGYGDFYPTTVPSKIFTVFYIFLGVGLGLYIFSMFAKSILKGRNRRMGKIGKIIRKISNV